jgi:hypothetical protein
MTTGTQTVQTTTITVKARFVLALVAALGVVGLAGIRAEAAVPKRASLAPAVLKASDLPRGWVRAGQEAEDEFSETEDDTEEEGSCESAFVPPVAIGQLVRMYSNAKTGVSAISTASMFEAGEAEEMMRVIKEGWAACPKPGVTLSPVPNLGDEAVRSIGEDPTFGLTFESVVVRKGNVVTIVTVIRKSSTKSAVTPLFLAKKIVPRMSKAK